MKRSLTAAKGPVPLLPAGYGPFLAALKTRIRSAQVRAVLASHREMIQLYWDIGKGIAERQRTEKWGSFVIERLASDLQRAFPGIEGFSPRNMWRMRAFYLAYAEAVKFLPQPVAETLQRPVGELAVADVPQTVGQTGAAILPQTVAELPWGQNIVLLEKVSNHAERLWYARMAFENGWSRSILALQIESGLFRRQGKAATNFKLTLPPPQSDLAQQALKDPYVFDFLTLRGDANERALERDLVSHVEKFLLELGAGFALVGRQVHLEVGGDDFYIDLLFYHLKLRCYVVIDLKTRAFVPEYAGKMNFYLSAVDDLYRHPGDQPSIGLILCKTRNKVVAEYALRDIRKPVGVSGYVTRLVETLPVSLKDAVPSVAEIERELAADTTGKRAARPAKPSAKHGSREPRTAAPEDGSRGPAFAKRLRPGQRSPSTRRRKPKGGGK